MGRLAADASLTVDQMIIASQSSDNPLVLVYCYCLNALILIVIAICHLLHSNPLIKKKHKTQNTKQRARQGKR